MKLTVYHLKACDTCRKALKTLKAAGADVQAIDVRADGLTEETLKHLISAVGPDALVNRRSTTWRNLSDAEKSDIDEAKALTLLSANPTLMKRPVIDTGTHIHVGWNKDVQSELT